MFLKRQVMESISIDSLDSGGVKGNYVELSSLVFEGSSLNETKSRSSRPEVFCKKCVFKNFVKFTGKPETLFKSDTSNFFIEHLW